MSARVARAALNGAALFAMAHAFLSMTDMISRSTGDWMPSQRGGLLQFLTMWALALASVTTLFALQESIIDVPVLSTIRRLLALVAAPLSVVVTALYWPMVLFAPSLMSSPEMTTEDGQPAPFAIMFPLPLGIDLGLHAVPLAVLLTDWLAFGHKYSKQESTTLAPIAAVSTGIVYGTWVEWCASANKTFPYPFLNIPFPGRLAIYVGATGLALLAFKTVNALHPTAHPADAKAAHSEKRHVDDEEWETYNVADFVWFNRVKL